MLEHLSTEQIEGYRNRTLSIASLLAADKHLSQCQSCRARLDESGRLRAVAALLRADLLRAKTDSDHLSYDLLEKYVDGKADRLDRETVENHVELCSRCAAETSDLRAFAAMMAESRATKKPVEEKSSRKGLLAWLTPLRMVATAATAVLLVAVTVSVWMILRTQNGSRPSDVAQSGRASGAHSNTNAAPLMPGAQSKQGSPLAQSNPSGTGEGRGESGGGLAPGGSPPDYAAGLANKPKRALEIKTATFALMAGQAATLNIPSDVFDVKLQLGGFNESDYENFMVTVSKSGNEGSTIWQKDASKAGNKVPVTIPAMLLTNGDYSLMLKGGLSASGPVVGNYYLHVVRH